jgi:exo-1,4-beta-D-glucosaminidase
MAGPYVWHPPYYWFSERYGPARGSSAEEGDNEVVPPLESLKKFIPADKLWPINEYWYFHCGAIPDNNTLGDARRVLEKRYGPSGNVEDFVKKAQVANYEDVRARYEAYATHWSNRKMTMNWMLNTHWPSFFGHLFDYYFKQGGGYFGAKKGLQPVSVVWDYYATGDRKTAHVYAVNQQLDRLANVKVTLQIYNLDGTLKSTSESKNLDVPPSSSIQALSVGRISSLSAVYFVRCRMLDATGQVLAENVYWQSQTNDDIGPANNDSQFATKLVQWADLSSLNSLPPVKLSTSATYDEMNGLKQTKITLANNSNHIAFFVRAEVMEGADGNEILPIRYSDNYVTIFPHETRVLDAYLDSSEVTTHPALQVEGYNVPQQVIPLSTSAARRSRARFRVSAALQ